VKKDFRAFWRIIWRFSLPFVISIVIVVVVVVVVVVVLRSKVSIRIARACRSIFRTEQAVDRDAVCTRSLFGTLEVSSLTP